MLKNGLEKDPYLVKDAGGVYPPVKNNGGFAFSKQREYDSIYDQYKSRPDFAYDINADALYQQYKDSYIQQGRLAMQDTMGQAAALTGGYGNSYAQSVGQQAYRAHLSELNDITPQLYQMALDRYNAKGEDMLNMLGLLGDERNFEYGAWADDYNRFVAERAYQDNLAAQEYELAAQEYEKGNVLDDKGNVLFNTNDIPGYNGADASYFDSQGNFKVAKPSDSPFGIWGFGYVIDGEYVATGPGMNPYTKSINEDIQYGVLSENRYQPDNINNEKLTRTDEGDYINGVWQSIWQTPDGELWIWDDTQNKYLSYKE
jgi:hypothetical protein